MPSEKVIEMLDIAKSVVTEWKYYDRVHGGRYGMNLEYVLSMYAEKRKLTVQRLCHVGMTVSTTSDKGSWRKSLAAVTSALLPAACVSALDATGSAPGPIASRASSSVSASSMAAQVAPLVPTVAAAVVGGPTRRRCT